MKKIRLFLITLLLTACLTANAFAQTVYPPYFSARDVGWIPNVDSQLETEACWTFTQNDLIEANVAKKTGVVVDYSEQAMKFMTSFVYNDKGFMRFPNGAGQEYMSTAYLSAYGSVLESDMPFSMSEQTSVDLDKLTYHGYLDHAKMFNYGVNTHNTYPADAVEKIKELITEYGAVGTGLFYIGDSGTADYSDDDYSNYYYNGTISQANHSVTIIGWDDNYNAANFSQTPAGDGAFIVKNSWGYYHAGNTTDIVYVSYYDRLITNEFYVSDYEAENNLFDNRYQYDYHGWTANGYIRANSVLCVSRFTAKSLAESVNAVSTYIVKPNTKIEVFVNTVDGNAKNSSAFKKVYEDTFEDVGYYLMDFTPQSLSSKTYAVAIRYSYGSSFTEFPIVCNYAGLINNSKNIPGMCYIGTDFSNVMPFESAFKGGDGMLCIKAFTVDTDIASASERFDDIQDDKWYTEAVNYVVRVGIFNGTGDTTFEPNTVMSRAMFVRVLANLSGVATATEGDSTFTDVSSGSWYQAAVDWACTNDIVNGTGGGKFSPNSPVTREQMCTMIVRYAKFLDITLDTSIPKTVFADDSTINSYAKESVYICQAAGIINGADGNKFNPLDSAARSHVANLLMKFCKNCVY